MKKLAAMTFVLFIPNWQDSGSGVLCDWHSLDYTEPLVTVTAENCQVDRIFKDGFEAP